MSRREVFATTHPSQIPRLLQKNPTASEDEWFKFIQRYEEPIAVCVRGLLRGAPPWAPAAEDVALSFFGYLLEHKVLARWERERSPLRAFVQGVLHRYVRGQLRSCRPLSAVDIDQCDEGLAARAGILDEELERRWAYQVLVLALRNLANLSPALIDVWLALQGLDWLVAARDPWVFLSFDEATREGDSGRSKPPVTPEQFAEQHDLAKGTVHNRKYEANTVLLAHVRRQVEMQYPESEGSAATIRLLGKLIDLVPELALLVGRLKGG